MSVYLLDTNTCVEVLRNRNQHVVRRFTATAPNNVRLCSVVKGELFYGARKGSRATANLATLAVFFASLVSLPFDDAAADIYGTIRADLEKRGMPIGPNDTMIAAIALQHGLTVATHNTNEFSRVTGLQVEDWTLP
ncbi:MAG TPA: type II toxin-antitoxin system VapC family toxin [Pirellulales bacterium]|nr:type II toxin-antitoxin system VapC family toxin [Pirellulales bacterium]